MKKNVIKTAFAAVCVVAAGMGGMKAYNTANQSEADLLLAENVEALTRAETNTSWSCVGDNKKCKISCGMCGTSIKGRGTLNGSHSCGIY